MPNLSPEMIDKGRLSKSEGPATGSTHVRKDALTENVTANQALRSIWPIIKIIRNDGADSQLGYLLHARHKRNTHVRLIGNVRFTGLCRWLANVDRPKSLEIKRLKNSGHESRGI